MGNGGISMSNELKELAHQGDPCVFCGTPHDEVSPDKCPAFIRHGPPQEGEWFLESRARLRVVQAMFDFSIIQLPILRFYPFTLEPEKRRRICEEAAWEK